MWLQRDLELGFPHRTAQRSQMVDVFPPDQGGVLNVGTGPFPLGGVCAHAQSEVSLQRRIFSPRAAVKSVILLFHTWGFVSLAVQPASPTHFSQGIPPNCFLRVSARLEESELRSWSELE